MAKDELTIGSRTYTLQKKRPPKMSRVVSMELVPNQPVPSHMSQKSTPNHSSRRVEGSVVNSSMTPVHKKDAPGRTTIKLGDATVHLGDPVWMRERGAYPFAQAILSSIGPTGVHCKVMLDSGMLVEKRVEELYAANPPQLMPDDHSALTHLNEPCVLHSTSRRFASDKIYTYTGGILVAMNPFRSLDIYGQDAIEAHRGTDDSTSLPPHVYSIAERAYSRLRSVHTDQAIVMSGESGAGKTETARLIVNYLVARAGSQSTLGDLAHAIVESAGIAEAFGNAKTRRNHNSSRFGKHMMLAFGADGSVVSATMQTYMLERSRVTQLIADERSYHVLYQLLATEDGNVREATGLEDMCVAKCRVLASSQCPSIPGVSDLAMFVKLDASMHKIGFAFESRLDVYRSLAAVLHLSNVCFEATEQDNTRAQVTSNAHDSLDLAGELLGCEVLGTLLTMREITTAGRSSVIKKPLSTVEAAATRDAMARAIYSNLFHWLEEQLNRHLFGDGSAKAATGDDEEVSVVHNHISLLDIFGFEKYPTNGFEQLCINYCNEKIQHFFLLTMFKQEQEVAEAEGVEWPKIDFLDNTGCVEAIDKVTAVGPGVLRLLESQAKVPESSDARFFEDVNRCHKASEFFKTVQKVKKRPSEAFIISHYAGDVCYGLERGSWIERETDRVRVDCAKAMQGSSVQFIRTIFDKSLPSTSKKQQLHSVSRRFIADLQGVPWKTDHLFTIRTLRMPHWTDVSVYIASTTAFAGLMTRLKSGETHFVRCIKPNDKNSPQEFMPKLVLEQLRASGVFDAVDLMKRGYPTRIPYTAIHGKFSAAMPEELAALSPSKFSELCALAFDVGKSDYALGRTQLFTRAGKGGLLEAAISLNVSTGASVLEQHIKDYKVHVQAMRLVTTMVLSWHVRSRFLRRLRVIRRVQAMWRGRRVRLVTGTIGNAALAALIQKRDKDAKPMLPVDAQGHRRKKKLKLPPAHQGSRPAASTLSGRTGPSHELMSSAPQDTAHIARLTSELEKEKSENSSLRKEIASLKEEVELLRKSTADANLTMISDFAESVAQKSELIEELRKEVKTEQERSAQLEQKLQDVRAERDALEEELEATSDDEPEYESNDPNEQVILARADLQTEESAPEMLGSLEERITVNITRDEISGTLGVDVDKWQGRVTVAVISPGVPAEGKLQVGDEIEGVGGVEYGDITSVIKAIVESPDVVSLQICRRPAAIVLRAEMLMCTNQGKWQYVMLTLLSTRLLLYELPEQAISSGIVVNELGATQGEVNLHDATRLELLEGNTGEAPTLRISLESGTALLFRSEASEEEGTAAAGEKLRCWLSQMSKMKMGDGVVHQQGTVWQQGFLELCVGLEEWETCYFVLEDKIGFQIFADQAAFRAGAEPTLSVPTSAIGKALRSTGQSWYEFGLQIHLVPTHEMLSKGHDDTMVEVRAPSHNEMLRWLATLNLKGAEWHAGAAERKQIVADAKANEPLVQLEASSIADTINKELSARREASSRRGDTPRQLGAIPPQNIPQPFVPKLVLQNVPAHSPSGTGKKPQGATYGKGGRRYSSVHAISAMKTPLETIELMGAWFQVKEEHTLFTKQRYCKLIGTNGKRDMAGQKDEYAKVSLVMLRREGEPLQNGRALDVSHVVNSQIDPKLPRRIIVTVGHKHMRLTAADMRVALDFRSALLKYSSQLRQQASDGDGQAARTPGRVWLVAGDI